MEIVIHLINNKINVYTVQTKVLLIIKGCGQEVN